MSKHPVMGSSPGGQPYPRIVLIQSSKHPRPLLIGKNRARPLIRKSELRPPNRRNGGPRPPPQMKKRTLLQQKETRPGRSGNRPIRSESPQKDRRTTPNSKWDLSRRYTSQNKWEPAQEHWKVHSLKPQSPSQELWFE